MLVRSLCRRTQWIVNVNAMQTELEEEGVRIALTIVDTPGFGDNIDNEFAYEKYSLTIPPQTNH